MGVRRTKHAVFDLKYHLVWIPKYRRQILVGEAAQYAKEVLWRIADEYGFWVDVMEVMEDHVHVFLEAPPRYSPAEVVQIMKSISARELFRRFPRLREQLWASELWSDGYFVRSVGDQVTTEVIRHYIEYHVQEQTFPQPPLFD
jgi:putative transposase